MKPIVLRAFCVSAAAHEMLLVPPGKLDGATAGATWGSTFVRVNGDATVSVLLRGEEVERHGLREFFGGMVDEATIRRAELDAASRQAPWRKFDGGAA